MDSETTAPARPTSAASELAPKPKYQLVHIDALEAALAKLGIDADAAQLLAAVRQHEERLRPRPSPPAEVPLPPPNRERVKDPAVLAARKRLLDEANAKFPNGFPEPISLWSIEEARKHRQG